MKSCLLILLLASAQPQLSEQIVVTASALPETVESTPAAVTVITKDDFDKRAARDVADVLREVPGLTVSRTGSQGRATSLFTRGAASTHTLVLWNGIEINNPYFAGYDWGRFSTVGVEQVEIVRGPFSALYGSDAVAGVVNVLTTPKSNGVRGSVEVGGRGLRNGQIAASWVGSEQVLNGSFERREDDGFAPNDDFAQNSANLLWRWTSPSHLSIGVAGRYTSYDLGVPTNLNAFTTALVPSLNRRQEGNERQIAVPITQTIGAFSYDVALSETRRSDSFHDPDDPFFTIDSTTESTTRRARLATHTTTPIGTIVAGGEIERATVNDKSNFGPNLDDDHRNERSFFVEDRFSRQIGNASRVEISAGARYDHFDTFGSTTSPRLAAAWISGSNKVRVAYGQAFRAPSIGELYFPFAGNRDLQPERSHGIEAGYDRAMGTAGQFSITAFRSKYRDLITFDNRTFLFGNVGRAEAQGLELGLTRTFTPSLYTSASLTLLDKPLPRRPRVSGSFFAGYRAGNVDANIVIAHTGARDDVLPVFPFTSIGDDAFTTVDANVQMHFARFTPFVKIENATNTKYEEVRGYPSPARRASIGIRFSM